MLLKFWLGACWGYSKLACTNKYLVVFKSWITIIKRHTRDYLYHCHSTLKSADIDWSKDYINISKNYIFLKKHFSYIKTYALPSNWNTFMCKTGNKSNLKRVKIKIIGIKKALTYIFIQYLRLSFTNAH